MPWIRVEKTADENLRGQPTVVQEEASPIQGAQVEYVDKIPVWGSVTPFDRGNQLSFAVGKDAYELIRNPERNLCEVKRGNSTLFEFRCAKNPANVLVGDFNGDDAQDIGLEVDGAAILLKLNRAPTFLEGLGCTWKIRQAQWADWSNRLQNEPYWRWRLPRSNDSLNRAQLCQTDYPFVAINHARLVAANQRNSQEDRFEAVKNLYRLGERQIARKTSLAMIQDLDRVSPDLLSWILTWLKEQGDTEVATDTFFASGMAENTRPGARLSYAGALAKIDRVDWAAKIYVAITRLPPTEWSGLDVQFLAAKELQELGREKEAKEAFLLFARSRAGANVRIAAATELYEKGEREAAIQTHVDVLETGNVPIYSVRDIARQLDTWGEEGRATEALARLIQREDADPRSQVAAISILKKENRGDPEVILARVKAILQDPKKRKRIDPNERIELIEGLYKMGEREAAVQYARKEAANKKSDGEHRLRAVKSLIFMGDQAGAVQAYLSIGRDGTNATELRSDAARFLESMQKREEANVVWTAIGNDHRLSGWNRLTIADRLEELDYKRGAKEIRVDVAATGGDSTARIKAAGDLYRMGEKELAIRYYSSFLGSDSDHLKGLARDKLAAIFRVPRATEE